MDVQKVPIIGVSRHRFLTDGEGVTTLVAFSGCPLCCKYCLNPQCKTETGEFNSFTPQQLHDKVKIDDLYFLVTGGGITFGGGEPLTHAEFIYDFHDICPIDWRFTAETSLHISKENLYIATQVIDDFIVDIKDMNPEIYKAYTGRDNARVIENLKILIQEKSPECIRVRVPAIRDFNTKEDMEASVQILKEMNLLYVL